VKEHEIGGAYSTQRGDEKFIQFFFIGKHEGKRPVERLRCRWEDNIRMDLREIGWGGMNQINLLQDRDQWLVVVSMIMNFQIP
jgi:hypothetical protein